MHLVYCVLRPGDRVRIMAVGGFWDEQRACRAMYLLPRPSERVSRRRTPQAWHETKIIVADSRQPTQRIGVGYGSRLSSERLTVCGEGSAELSAVSAARLRGTVGAGGAASRGGRDPGGEVGRPLECPELVPDGERGHVQLYVP